MSDLDVYGNLNVTGQMRSNAKFPDLEIIWIWIYPNTHVCFNHNASLERSGRTVLFI